MYLLDQKTKTLKEIKKCTFKGLNFKERQDLQQWIISNPSSLGEDLLIIQEEFDGWDDTKERLDLLALDKQGRLVIIENKLDDSTVTIVLVGSCTHSRRYVDWEVKASLQQGQTLPNGLIAINLPYMDTSGNLPSRVKENVTRDYNKRDIGYARYYPYPKSKRQLEEWIEDAYNARTQRANLIKNSNEMMKYNATCNTHGFIH